MDTHHTIPMTLLQPRIGLPLKGGERLLVHPDELLYCEAGGSYAVLHMADGSTWVSCRNLLKVERVLPVGIFHRIDRSVLINLNHVASFRRTGHVTMTGGETFRAAKGKREELARLLRERYHIIP